jgi:arylsulfatase A-like enzyme
MASRDRSRANNPLQICRGSVWLAAALFALESSVTHVFSALGYGDTRLTWALWSQHLAVYLGTGLLAGAGPTLAAFATRSQRHPSWYQAVVPRVLLVIYVVVLQVRGLIELVPLVHPALFAVAVLWILDARYGTTRRNETPPNRSIVVTAGCATWAALLYVSIGPLAASHLSKEVLTSTQILTLSVLFPASCLIVAGGVAWHSSAGTQGTSVDRPRGRRPRAIVIGLAAGCYALLALAATQRDFTWLRGSHVSAAREERGRPFDLLFIIVDSLRADRLGAYGHREARTPHLDRLAARSVLYADHVTASPWTYPSFATLFTGQSPSAHGARRLSWPPNPEHQPGVPELGMMRPDLPTLATILKEHGYETAFIGTNWALSGSYGLARGFDFYSDPLTTDLYVTLGTLLRERHPWDRTVDAEEMTERFLAYLEKRRDRPVALVAHYMDPHVPYVPPLRFRDRTVEMEDQAGATPLEVMSAESVASLYDGEVSYVDEQFGRLWRYLEDAGRIGTTVVALTSDHGEMLQAPGHQADLHREWPIADSYARRALDHGHNVSQDLLHVPFMLYGPALRPRLEQSTTRAIDVLPTLLAALNLDIPSGLEGRSVRDGVEADMPALAESVLYGVEKKSWREGRYKLIYRPEYPERQQFELYDLSTDPGESHNLAEEQPDRVQAMGGRLRSYLKQLSTTDPSPAPIDRQTIERLRSLGYVK